LTPSDILARYDIEMRQDPPLEPGIRIERAGSIVRAVGRFNCILYSHLDPENADAAIVEQKTHFREASAEIEWKVYAHDPPPDLAARLAAAGFKADDPETLMAFDLANNFTDGATTSRLDLRRIHDEHGLAHLVAVNKAIWTHGSPSIYESYAQRLNDPSLGLYVAYENGEPVAAARLEMPEDRTFAGLWGGCTLAAHRGRGIFRALVTARAREARDRGFRFLNVDAAETSRPILERLGFIALTGVTGWRFSGAES
jgi:GNAT superfamily N-acetyltransferase